MSILMTRCIYLPSRLDDGRRISVMSRHTLPDGVTPDSRITGDSFHDHFPELGPPPKLIGAYYRGEVTWNEFAMLYREHLYTSKVAKQRITQVIHYARQSRVTLLCCEAEPDRCHRRLLAEWIGELVDDLTIVIK